MKSSEYWKDRQEKLWKNLEKDEAVLIEKMDEYYERQCYKLEKEIAGYFSMYGKDNVVVYRKLLMGLPKAEKQLLYQQHDKFMERYPQYSHLIPIRESIYKLDRLQGLNYSMLMQQVEMGIKEEKEVRKHLEKVYGRAYAEINKEFNIVDREGAKLLLEKKWVNGGNFSSNIWNNREKLIRYLTRDFRDGIIRGDNYNKIAKQMRERFVGRSKSDIKRLVFTEGTYVNNQAMMKPFADSGLYEKYEYVAVLDNKTSQICRDLDGEEFKIKDQEPGVNFPPMHPNCRSTFNIVIPEETSLKAEKQEETGYNYDNIKSFNDSRIGDAFFRGTPEYKKWFKSITAGETEAIKNYTDFRYENINSYNRKNKNWDKNGQYGSIIEEARRKITGPIQKLTKRPDESLRDYQRKVLTDPLKLHKEAIMEEDMVTGFNSGLDSMISKFELTENIQMVRGVSKGSLPQFNKIEDLIDQEYTDPSYMSTSPTINSAFRTNYILELKIPKGTGRGAYLEELTSIHGEHEFLLARDSKFKITNVRTEKNTNYIEMEMI